MGRLETREETAARLESYDFPGELATSVPTRPDHTSAPTNDGAGRADGVDVLPGPARHVTADATHGLDRLHPWCRRPTDYGRNDPFDYERRHGLSVVGQLRLRAGSSWR